MRRWADPNGKLFRPGEYSLIYAIKICAPREESLYKYQHNIKMGWHPITLYCNLISYGHQDEMSGVESLLNASQPPLTISCLCISIDVGSSTTSQTSSVLSYNEMAIFFAFPRLNFQTLFKVSNQFSPNLVRCLVFSLSVFTELEGNNPN